MGPRRFGIYSFLIAIGRLPNGSAALASSSIAVTVMMLAVLPPMGVAQSVMALTGQHVGEKIRFGHKRHLYRNKMSAIYIFLLGITFILFPDFYLAWFQNNQNPDVWKEVAQISKNLLIFCSDFHDLRQYQL